MTGGSIEDNITQTVARLIAHKYMTIKDADVYAGVDSPNGRQIGKPGDFYLQNALNGGVWQKQIGYDTSGWTQIIGGAASGATIPYGLTLHTLNAAIVGSVATSTLRWQGTPTPDVAEAPLADWVTVTTTAELGTLFTILLPGRYIATLKINDQSTTGSATVAMSVAGGTPPIVLPQVDTVQAMEGKSDDNLPATLGASAGFFVTAAMIEAGTNIFRTQALGGQDIAPALAGMNLRYFGPITAP